MPEFHISVDIDAPPARVWQFMRDVERWPEWTASVTSVRPQQPPPLAVGHRVVVIQPRLPKALWIVTELIEGQSFTWINKAPGVKVTATHSVEPLGSGTRATLSLTYVGLFATLLAWLTRDITNRYIAMEAAGLKRRSEEAAAAT
jgi:hypothetical protein